MSPNTAINETHNESGDIQGRLNGTHIEATVPEEVLKVSSLSLHGVHRTAKTGGAAEDASDEIAISAKAAVGGLVEDDDRIEEYLRRSDTAVIYPEPVGRTTEEGKT